MNPISQLLFADESKVTLNKINSFWAVSAYHSPSPLTLTNNSSAPNSCSVQLVPTSAYDPPQMLVLSFMRSFSIYCPWSLGVWMLKSGH